MSAPALPETPQKGLRHIGALIAKVATSTGLMQREIAALARINPASLSTICARATMRSEMLWRFSIGLRHNFFADLATDVPAEFPSFAPVDDSKDRRIRELEEQLHTVTVERDILLKVIGRV